MTIQEPKCPHRLGDWNLRIKTLSKFRIFVRIFETFLKLEQNYDQNPFSSVESWADDGLKR